MDNYNDVLAEYQKASGNRRDKLRQRLKELYAEQVKIDMEKVNNQYQQRKPRKKVSLQRDQSKSIYSYVNKVTPKKALEELRKIGKNQSLDNKLIASNTLIGKMDHVTKNSKRFDSIAKLIGTGIGAAVGMPELGFAISSGLIFAKNNGKNIKNVWRGIVSVFRGAKQGFKNASELLKKIKEKNKKIGLKDIISAGGKIVEGIKEGASTKDAKDAAKGIKDIIMDDSTSDMTDAIKGLFNTNQNIPEAAKQIEEQTGVNVNSLVPVAENLQQQDVEMETISSALVPVNESLNSLTTHDLSKTDPQVLLSEIERLRTCVNNGQMILNGTGAQLVESQQRNNELSQQVFKLSESLRKVLEERNNAIELYKNSSAYAAQMEQNMKAAQSAYEKLQNENKTLVQKIDQSDGDFKRQIESRTQELNDLQSRFNRLKEGRIEAQLVANNAYEENKALTARIKELSTQLAFLNSANKSISEKSEKQLTRIEGLQKELNSAKEKSKSLQEQVDETEAARKQQLVIANEKQLELNKKLALIPVQDNRIKELQQVILANESKIRTLEGQLTIAERKVNDYQIQLSDADERSKQSLMALVEKENEKLIVMTNENNNQIVKLEEEIKENKEEISRLTNEKNLVQVEVIRITQDKEALARINEQHKSIIQDVSSQLEVAQNQLNKQNKINEEQCGQLIVVKNEIDSLNQLVKKTKEEYKGLRLKYETAEEANKRLLTEKQDADKKIVVLNNDIEDNKSTISRLEGEISRLNKKAQENFGQRQAYERQIAMINQQITELQNQNHKLADDLEKMQRARIDINQQLATPIGAVPFYNERRHKTYRILQEKSTTYVPPGHSSKAFSGNPEAKRRKTTQGSYIVGGRPDPETTGKKGRIFWDNLYRKNYHLL